MIKHIIIGPNCGTGEQEPLNCCRMCGSFVPDLDGVVQKEQPIEVHLTSDSFLTLITAAVSLIFAIVVHYTFWGREGVPRVIYPAAGFLLAMTAWQIQTYVRTGIMKMQIDMLRPKRESVPISAA